MEFYLIYIDESFDNQNYVYSALFVPASHWDKIFNKIVEWRHELFKKHDIQHEYELHATKLIRGEGQPRRNSDKTYRANLFAQSFDFIESLDHVMIMNGIIQPKRSYPRLFDYMLNRIHRTLEAKNAYGILICDQGNEGNLTSILRHKKKTNLIPSNEYHREHGYNEHNVPLDRIIEDPLFKVSDTSYFIQIADFVAFGLLRNECPLPETREEVRTAFEKLDQRLIRKAFSKDPKGKGIVRP